MKTVRLGLIGTGYWGPNILRNACDLPEFEVRAVCDRDPVRLAPFSRRYPTVRRVSDAAELFRDKTLDAVAIATPVSTHYPLVRAALEAGKDVFVEKPLAARAKDAERLVQIARRRDRVLMVDHIFVYSPAVQKIRQIVAAGELGALYYFDSVRINLGLFQKDVNVIWDLAPHDFSIMDHLIDAVPVAVAAQAFRHVPRGTQEDLAHITVRHKGGVSSHIHVNWLAPAKIRRILVGGSRRMVVYDDTDPIDKVKVYDKGVTHDPLSQRVEYRVGDMWAPQVGTTEALKIALRHFAECVRRRKTPITDGAAGLRVVRLLEAATLSARRGGREVVL